MAATKEFTIYTVNDRDYFVKMTYNDYHIINDYQKGIGIYAILSTGAELLLKQYYHHNMLTAINYLLGKEFKFKKQYGIT